MRHEQESAHGASIGSYRCPEKTGRGYLASSLGWIKNFSTPQVLYEQGIFTGTNDEVTGRLGASYLPRANRL